MNQYSVDEDIFNELKQIINSGLASGSLMTPAQVDEQLALFNDRFGPAVLRNIDGEGLLKLMHGREQADAKCLMYWLEFKDDADFAGKSFGTIGGGSSYMYGVFQRQSDRAWITGPPQNPRVISVQEAIAIARRQRDQLLSGDEVLSAFTALDTSDENYAQLQADMERAAPDLSGLGWAHKYWFLLHPHILDDFHSPRHQRFHLLKLLQMPPDQAGIRLGGSDAPRFLCAGRFVSLARPSVLLYATMNRKARDEQIRVQQPFQGSSAISATVILRPVSLPRLAELVSSVNTGNNANERRHFAAELVAV